jgi:PAS domain S-box-containing protein
MIAPLIVTWATSGLETVRKAHLRHYVEGTFLLAGLFLVSFAILYNTNSGDDWLVIYLPLPFLLWAAVRFGSCGASTAVATVAFLAIWSARHGHGPFSGGAAEQNVLSIQVFLILVSVPMMFLAAVIEERSQGEVMLREREERISLAAESADLAFWTINFERNESWMNNQGREIFNFAPDEPLSRERFLSRVHPEDRDAVGESIARARATSPTFEFEYRLLRPDGETRWLISRGRYVRNDRGEIIELIGVAIDITAQVKANLKLRLQHEELARMSRVSSMGELTASLAHELNQPLTAIASNAAAGRRMLGQGLPDPEMFAELLADVSADARRAGDIIHGIHHFVRKGEGTRGAVNLNEIVREVLRLLHSDLLGRETTVRTDLPPGLPAVEADPVHLQQVLVNLLMNSLEAMQSTPAERRRIVISTSCDADSFVLVSVRDHGGGLPQDNLEKIFDHFYSTKPNGMGMGLTIVRSIVEGHGGNLIAENTEEGARVSFRLPVARKAESQEVA